MADRVQTIEQTVQIKIFLVQKKKAYSVWLKWQKGSKAVILFKLTDEVVEWRQFHGEWGSEQTNAAQSDWCMSSYVSGRGGGRTWGCGQHKRLPSQAEMFPLEKVTKAACQRKYIFITMNHINNKLAAIQSNTFSYFVLPFVAWSTCPSVWRKQIKKQKQNKNIFLYGNCQKVNVLVNVYYSIVMAYHGILMY